MAMVPPVAYSQQDPDKPVQSEGPRDGGTSSVDQRGMAEQPVRYKRVVVRPSEGYLAGFGGYTFGGKFDADASGSLNGAAFGNRSLATSAVVGAKAGGFFPQSLSWFGVEAELYSTTPHIEQQGTAPGSHMSVTTVAINAIARLQLGCEPVQDHEERVTERFTIQYDRDFCRLQPYAGVGLGINWLDMSNNSFSAHANVVPGFNALGGVRYYVTEHISMFTEYKYNRATFSFLGPAGLSGFSGVYSVNHIVGGFAYHY